METDDGKKVLEQIRDASVFDILLVTVVLLPFYLAAWLVVLGSVTDMKTEQGRELLVVLVVVYVAGIVLMKVGAREQDRLKRAASRIRSYLRIRGFTFMTFERIRERIDKTYTDMFLGKVIEEFSDEFTTAKSGTGKTGIKLALNDEEEK
jgi:hypothetical protein